jgi:hypothetical protein
VTLPQKTQPCEQNDHAYKGLGIIFYHEHDIGSGRLSHRDTHHGSGCDNHLLRVDTKLFDNNGRKVDLRNKLQDQLPCLRAESGNVGYTEHERQRPEDIMQLGGVLQLHDR